MKPIIILPPDTMSADDIKLLRDNGLCVVVSADPAKVKFLDPIPSAVEHTNVESAAIALSRRILAKGTYDSSSRATFAAMYVDLLVKGTKLDPDIQVEQEVYNREKLDEIARLARQDAREERAAKRKQQEEEAKKKQAEQKGEKK